MKAVSGLVCMFCASIITADAGDLVLKDFDNLKSWHAWLGGKIANGEEKSIVLTLPGTMERNFTYTKAEEENFKNFQGVSFRAKGDGKRHTVYLALRTKALDRSIVNVAPFLIEGSDWKTYHAAWSDFINESWDADMNLNTPDGVPVSADLQGFTFGNPRYLTYANKRLEPYKVEFADLRLLEKAQPRCSLKSYPMPSLKSVMQKMAQGEKVLIYCHGDSITAGTGVGEKRYPVLLEKMLREHFKNNQITVKTIAVGGAKTTDLRISAEADFADENTPDLVTVTLGFNDKTIARPKEFFHASMNDLVSRMNHFTQGKSCILLMTTIPGKGSRFTAQDNYAREMQKIAAGRALQCFDMAKLFRDLGPEGADVYFKDIAHPNQQGHELMAKGLMKYLLGNL